MFVIKRKLEIPTYLIVAGDHAIWSINPKFGSIETLDKAKVLIFRLGMEESEFLTIENYQQELENYSKFIKTGNVGSSFELNTIDMFEIYDKNKHSKEDVFFFHLKKEKCPYSVYKTWPKPYEIFKNIGYIGLYSGKEPYSEIKVFKKSKYSDFETEINYLKENLYKDHKKFSIRIFDRFLSENGNSVDLCYDNGTWSVTHRESFEILQGTLLQCFNFLKKERYYE